MELNKFIFNILDIFWKLINLITIFIITSLIYLYVFIDNYNIRIYYKHFKDENDTNHFDFSIKRTH